MTETRPSREELEAKAKELKLELAELEGAAWELSVVSLLLSVGREAREDAVERCAKRVEQQCGKIAHGLLGKGLADDLRAFKPEEPDE